LSAIMPISDGMGLVFSVTGYNDTIVVSFTGCYEQLPDPEVLAQCLRDSFQQYLALAQRANRKPRAKAAKPPRLAAAGAKKPTPRSKTRVSKKPVAATRS